MRSCSLTQMRRSYSFPGHFLWAHVGWSDWPSPSGSSLVLAAAPRTLRASLQSVLGQRFTSDFYLEIVKQRNGVLEIEEADEFKKLIWEAVFAFRISRPFKFQVRTVGPGRCILTLVPCQELGVSSTEEWFKSNLSLSTPKWTLPQ